MMKAKSEILMNYYVLLRKQLGKRSAITKYMKDALKINVFLDSYDHMRFNGKSVLFYDFMMLTKLLVNWLAVSLFFLFSFRSRIDLAAVSLYRHHGITKDLITMLVIFHCICYGVFQVNNYFYPLSSFSSYNRKLD